MAAATRLTGAPDRRRSGTAGPRLVAAVVLLSGWQALAVSGLLFRDVVPPLQALAAGLWSVVTDPGFWANALVTGGELLAAVLIGGLATAMLLTLLVLPALYPLAMDAKAPSWAGIKGWFGEAP